MLVPKPVMSVPPAILQVTEIKKTKIRVCEDGKSVLKKKEEVPFPYKLACGGGNTYQYQYFQDLFSPHE